MAEVRHAGELFLLCEYSESGMVARVIRRGHWGPAHASCQNLFVL